MFLNLGCRHFSTVIKVVTYFEKYGSNAGSIPSNYLINFINIGLLVGVYIASFVVFVVFHALGSLTQLYPVVQTVTTAQIASITCPARNNNRYTRDSSVATGCCHCAVSYVCIVNITTNSCINI